MWTRLSNLRRLWNVACVLLLVWLCTGFIHDLQRRNQPAKAPAGGLSSRGRVRRRNVEATEEPFLQTSASPGPDVEDFLFSTEPFMAPTAAAVVTEDIYTEEYVKLFKNFTGHAHCGEAQSVDVITHSILRGNVYKPYDVILQPDDTASIDDVSTFLVYVYSAPAHFRNRHAIRTTWGDPRFYSDCRPPCKYRLRVVFVLGVLSENDVPTEKIRAIQKQVARESCHHGDILLLNMDDSYRNLTLKGRLSMQWIARTLPRVKFIYKTDDDVILNVFGWMEEADWLAKEKCTTCLRCRVFPNSQPFRRGKWAVTRKDYPEETYPPFCSGTGYLMTKAAMIKIILTSRRFPSFPLEDVFFTGIVAARAKVERTDVGDRYMLFGNDRYRISPYDDDFRLITSDALDPDMWDLFWDTFVAFKHGAEVDEDKLLGLWEMEGDGYVYFEY